MQRTIKSRAHENELTIDHIMHNDAPSNIPPDEVQTADRLFDEIFDTIKQFGEHAGYTQNQMSSHLAEAQDLLVAFFIAAVEADGEIAPAENDYLNQLFALSNSPDQNGKFLHQFYAKWHKVEKRIPRFFQAAVDFDRDCKENAQYSDKLLTLLEQFENCAARTDKEFSPSERKVIRDYIEKMTGYKKASGSQS
jgi:hypothetical protein